MPSTWPRRASWLMAAPVALPVALLVAVRVALLLLGPAGSPVNLASIAALAIAAVVAWSLLRPSQSSPYGVGRRVPVPTHIVGPMRSSHPDAAGRPRPRAPGA
jgi:Family of unknown function (DUF6412)